MFCESTMDTAPDRELLEAVKEVEDMKRNPDKYKSYSSAEEMVADILWGDNF